MMQIADAVRQTNSVQQTSCVYLKLERLGLLVDLVWINVTAQPVRTSVKEVSRTIHITKVVLSNISVDDGEKVDLTQCGDPALGQYCCNPKGDTSGACCKVASNILTLGVGTSFPEGSLQATLMMAAMPNSSSTKTSFLSQVASTSTTPAQSTPPTASAGLSAQGIDIGTKKTTLSLTVTTITTASPNNKPSPIATPISVGHHNPLSFELYSSAMF